MAALEADPSAVMAFWTCRLVPAGRHRRGQVLRQTRGDPHPSSVPRRVARLEGSWWIPNRGVFRASAGREIGGLRRHRAGEFSADWPWLLEMSLLGAFVRIPERLVTKFYLPGSLSRSWRFGARQWAAVAASAMTAVARRRLSLRDRMRLRATISRRVLKQFRRSARSRMNRAHEGEARPRGASAAAGRPEPALVSVIVPVHDRFELAERAIRSVAAQTYRPIELIVVDDASTNPFLLRTGRVRFRCEARAPGDEPRPRRRAATPAGGWCAASLSPISIPTTSGRTGISPRSRRRCEHLRKRAWPTPRRWSCAKGERPRCGGGPRNPARGFCRRFSGSAHGIRAPASGAAIWSTRWAAGCRPGTGRTTSTTRARDVWGRSSSTVPEPRPASRRSTRRIGCPRAPAARRRIEGYVLAMLSISGRIRATDWFDDPAVRDKMRRILLTAAMRASEQNLARLAARAAFEAWRWPAPSASLVAATAVALPLVPVRGGRAAARLFRWARR